MKSAHCVLVLAASTESNLFFLLALRPNAGHGFLILEVSRSHTMTHYSRWDSSGRVISPSQ
jgi:hypothetical protein